MIISHQEWARRGVNGEDGTSSIGDGEAGTSSICNGGDSTSGEGNGNVLAKSPILDVMKMLDVFWEAL